MGRHFIPSGGGSVQELSWCILSRSELSLIQSVKFYCNSARNSVFLFVSLRPRIKSFAFYPSTIYENMFVCWHFRGFSWICLGFRVFPVYFFL
jgi:hypothetical protein